MRCGKEESEGTARGKENRLKLMDDEYAIVHCTGYIKVGYMFSRFCLRFGYELYIPVLHVLKIGFVGDNY